MKISVSAFIFIIINFLVCSKGVSQEINKGELERAKLILQRERETIFIQSLNLSVSQASVFHPTYLDFDREKHVLDDRLIKLFATYAASYENIDHRIMHDFIMLSEKHQQDELKVRKKYFKILSKSISPVVASQFYEVDDFISTVLRTNILMGLPFSDKIQQAIGK